jgi:ABC-2 type transport system permease protein
MSNQEEVQYSKSKLHGLWALTNRELKKWYQQPFVFAMGIIQPILWLALLGKAMNIGNLFSAGSLPPIPTLTPALTPSQLQGLGLYFAGFQGTIMQRTFGTADYFSFMAMSMVAFTVVFTTAFVGMSVVWDKRLGFMNKVLSTPVKSIRRKYSSNLPSSNRSSNSVRIRTQHRNQL